MRTRIPSPAPATLAALLALALLPACSRTGNDSAPGGAAAAAPPGMKLIPAGTFTMGSDAAYALSNEKPAHAVTLDAFYIDTHDVTNADFAKFVAATGYVTTAERPVDWEEVKKQVPPGTPKPPPEVLQPGSLVFVPTRGPVDLRDVSNWWHWVNGADWRHPDGPGSSIEGRDNLPVVQVSWEDAAAYAKWAGKRLPTEAEWEYAARGGLARARYPWGDEFQPAGKSMANTWTGDFPYRNTAADGFAGASPAGSFPPNGYGLHDMAGNVWNWCADVYHSDTYAARAGNAATAPIRNPRGPALTDPETPTQDDPSPPTVPGAERRVVKGGSYLCAPPSAESYRPSARRGSPPDTATTDTGFRCAKDAR